MQTVATVQWFPQVGMEVLHIATIRLAHNSEEEEEEEEGKKKINQTRTILLEAGSHVYDESHCTREQFKR